MANKQLPVGPNRAKWKTGTWDVQKCNAYSRSAASYHRSVARTEPPPWEAQYLLAQLGDSAALWLGLRRHLDVVDSIFILRQLAQHSTWKTRKYQEAEQTRREYLQLCNECLHYNPDWIHTAMAARRDSPPQRDDLRFQWDVCLFWPRSHVSFDLHSRSRLYHRLSHVCVSSLVAFVFCDSAMGKFAEWTQRIRGKTEHGRSVSRHRVWM